MTMAQPETHPRWVEYSLYFIASMGVMTAIFSVIQMV